MSRIPACVFCNIIAKTAEASIVHQDGDVTAFMDIRPVAPGHVLIVPNVHSPGLEGITDVQLGQMVVIARKLARALKESDLPCEGINFFLADGRAAGQTVFHLHLHVIPRFRGDGFAPPHPIGYGPRPSREELDRVAGIIRSAL